LKIDSRKKCEYTKFYCGKWNTASYTAFSDTKFNLIHLFASAQKALAEIKGYAEKKTT
jgi:hypothetical protein